MKLDERLEALVLHTVEVLGEASIEELMEDFPEEFKETSKHIVNRILNRWYAKDALTFRLSKGEVLWKLKNIPFPPSAKIPHVLEKTKKEIKTALKEFESSLQGSPVIRTRNKYRDYVKLKITLETIDPILAGMPGKKENTRIFIRDADEEPIINSAKFSGWTRDNILRSIGAPPAAKRKVGWTPAKIAPDAVGHRTAMSPKGPVSHECVKPGTQFTTILRYPLAGTQIQDVERLIATIDDLAQTPIRGLGANPDYYGGRFKIIDAQAVD